MDDEAQFGGSSSSSSYPTKDPNPLEAYDLMLRESNQHFLSELRKDRPNFRVLTSVFARHLQTMPDPPVEIIWFYSAVALRCQQQDHHHHLAAASVRDLFQLLVSCSVSCGAAKRVAVLAPLIFKLFQFLTRFQAMMMSSREEIDRLIEGVVSYINTCCVGDAISGDDRSDGGSTSDHLRLQCFVDSVRVWTVDLWQDPESWDFGEALELFFPLLSSRVYQGLGGGGGFGVGYLAGAVMTQALLLRLCYKCVSNSGGQSSRVELHNDMLSWTVGSVNGFLNWYFFDVFFSTLLLDPILPVTSLLSLEDEIFMRQVLYDAVVMVKYSFLNLESGIRLYSDNSKNLAIMWLLVVEDAMQFIRKHGDQAKAISYSEAFTKCHLCSQLVDWISSHTTVIRKNGRPVFSTPNGLIGWLLVLEYQGHLFFDKISKVNSRALECKLKSNLGISFVMPDCWGVDENLMCYIENGRRDEAEVDMDSSGEAMFLATSCTKSLSLTGGRRKREGVRIEGEARAKNFRYGFDRTPTGEMHLSSSREDRLRSGSEAGNFVFDECVDDMEL